MLFNLLSNTEEDIGRAVDTAELVLAWTTSEDGNVSQRVDTLAVVNRDGTVGKDALLLGVRVVVV
jgi:hypothetical protein